MWRPVVSCGPKARAAVRRRRALSGTLASPCVQNYILESVRRRQNVPNTPFRAYSRATFLTTHACRSKVPNVPSFETNLEVAEDSAEYASPNDSETASESDLDPFPHGLSTDQANLNLPPVMVEKIEAMLKGEQVPAARIAVVCSDVLTHSWARRLRLSQSQF